MTNEEKSFIKTVIATAVMVLIAIALCGVIDGCSAKADAETIRMDSLGHTYTAEGDMIKLYVIIDPDSGIEYLVSDHGGITPRIKQKSQYNPGFYAGRGSTVSYEYYEY